MEKVNLLIHETESSKSPDDLEPEKAKLDANTPASPTGGNVQPGKPSGTSDNVPETSSKAHEPSNRTYGHSPEANRGSVLPSTENTPEEKLDESGKVPADNGQPGIQSASKEISDIAESEVPEGHRSLQAN